MFSKIIWEYATPKSKLFDDFYFSSDSAIEESTYNYLKHNFLQEKFTKLNQPQFTICETGFGTGLNFILTMNLWHKYAHENDYLEYYSFEKYPITKEDLVDILKQFKNLSNYEELLKLYNPENGLNIYKFGNITLNLIIDDVNNIDLYHLPIINTWFLDGFSPAKNNSMWSDKLFENMNLLSSQNSSFATFTASSLVRKALQKNNFEVKKDTGFGKKREMMYGSFIG